ncbi:alpha/beta hydrolase [Adhaeribacter soli]|uniref:Phospholipase n=1 Tax=Adhaeribacter soli TaxID=2607655 RepID=A0A5N1J6L7_9BACT|nr:phospholipase [Adhaeribacter soli]KAA9345602.1 phospholipase [Adhaeribacter soli]
MEAKSNVYKIGRLTARPAKKPETTEVKKGLQKLTLQTDNKVLLYIPETYDANHPAALALMLHGSGAPAEQGLSLLRNYADSRNIILLAPVAREYTWDIIAGHAFGPDVLTIDQALEQVFFQYTIDPAHIAVGGFSDGASYALSLGLTNGDLFTHILAFSPGFAYTLSTNGKPAVFISHGIDDPVLPIDPCGRRIVPQLEDKGLKVDYHEFKGMHEIPANISENAAKWFLK